MDLNGYRFNVPNTNLTLEVGPSCLRVVGGQEVPIDSAEIRYALQEILRLAARVQKFETFLVSLRFAAGVERLADLGAILNAVATTEILRKQLTEKLEEQNVRLARLDALLASEEPPEGFYAALDLSDELIYVAARDAWRWLRDTLRGPVDDPAPEEEVDPGLIEDHWYFVQALKQRAGGFTVQREPAGEPSPSMVFGAPLSPFLHVDDLREVLPPPPAAVEGAQAVAPRPMARRVLFQGWIGVHCLADNFAGWRGTQGNCTVTISEGGAVSVSVLEHAYPPP